MALARVSLATKGLPDLFQKLKPALQRRVLRRTLEKAAQPTARAFRQGTAKIKSSDSTGTLNRRIRVSAKTDGGKLLFKHGQLAGGRSPVGDTYATVGGAKQLVLATLTRKASKYSRSVITRTVRRRPSKYLHLADAGGHAKRKSGRVHGFAGWNFRTPAIRSTRHIVVSTFHSEINTILDREIKNAVRSELKKEAKRLIAGSM